LKLPKVLGSVLLLSGSSFALRAIGMGFRVYLSGKLGLDGLGLMQLISSLGGFASLLCTAGLSTALLRSCAENPFSAKQWVRKAQLIAVPLGLTLAALLFFLAPFLCKALLRDARAVLPLRVLALSLPFIASSSCTGGYFLATGKIGKLTLAQFLEQGLRVAITAFFLEQSPKDASLELLTACVFLGSTCGELLSFLLHELFVRLSPGEREPLPKSPYPALWQIAGPIALATLLQSGMHTAENLLIPPMLALSGEGSALAGYGLLHGMVLPVLFFPAALPAALGTLRLPAVARLHAQGDMQRLRENVKLTLVSTMAFSMFALAVFVSLASPLMLSLYRSAEAATLLLALAPILPLLYLDSIADALLKGIGRQKLCLYVEIADSVLRLSLTLWLVPRLGLRGLILVISVSTLLTCLARVYALLRACALRSNALLAVTHASLPSIVSAAAACLAGLAAASLPDLPPLPKTILGLCCAGLAFGIFYAILSLFYRKRHEKAVYRFR
jgi:stage V sporulation protein B